MQIKMMIVVLSLTLLGGCSQTSVYVLDQAELVRVQANQTVTSKFKGWLLSDRAVDRVMNAKVKAVNLE